MSLKKQENLGRTAIKEKIQTETGMKKTIIPLVYMVKKVKKTFVHSLQNNICFYFLLKRMLYLY